MNSSWCATLFCAAQRGNVGKVATLVENIAHLKKDFGVNFDVANNFDVAIDFDVAINVAFRVALRNDCTAVVQYLWVYICPQVLTALFPYATTYGSADMVATYIHRLFPQEIEIMRIRRQSTMRSAMANACCIGNKRVAQRLVDIKASIDGMTADTPLYYAVAGGQTHVVLWLLQSKLSPDARIGFSKETPMQVAYRTRHKPVVRLLERALALRANKQTNKQSNKRTT